MQTKNQVSHQTSNYYNLLLLRSSTKRQTHVHAPYHSHAHTHTDFQGFISSSLSGVNDLKAQGEAEINSEFLPRLHLPHLHLFTYPFIHLSRVRSGRRL